MIIKMQPAATPQEIEAVEAGLHALGYKTGKMVGEEVTLIGVYGTSHACPKKSLPRCREWIA